MRRIAWLLLLCAHAHAGGLVVDWGSPRAVGRAGAGTVSDDGGGALIVNPAALARRDSKRAQLGLTISDDAIDWRDSSGDAPRAHDQAGSSILPLVAAEGAVGDWIVGAGVMTTTASERALRSPGRLPTDQYGNLFDYRYAGLYGALRRDTFTAGAARRMGDSAAVGFSLGVSRVSIAETRRMWCGFVDRKDQLVPPDPAHDVELAIDAHDNFSPSAVAGILVAPEGTRLELAASLAWTRAAHAEGDITAAGTTQVSPQLASPTARITVREPLTARAGARWVGARWIAETDLDLWMMPVADATWQLSGVKVVDATGVAADVSSLPSRVSTRTHGAVRAALDVQLIAGFLWATAGYAYATAGTRATRLAPTFGDLGGHTAAIGLEASAGDFTITLGWARTWSLARTTDSTTWRLDNPFFAGDAAAPTGSFDGSRDFVGIAIDSEL